VLGTWLFVALWVLLGLAVFFVAIRGGFGARRPAAGRPSPGARRFLVATLVIIYVGFGIAIPLGFLVGNHANANSQVGGLPLTASEKEGRQLFGQHCGVCHTLAAANAVGKVGPNLDVIKPSEVLVFHTIQFGCLQTPPPGDHSMSCLGFGNMPATIVQGQQAQDVAQFVARVAGQE
jgi:mono/diheme cytochrome c family protein